MCRCNTATASADCTPQAGDALRMACRKSGRPTEGFSTGSGIRGRAAGCSQCTRTGGDAPRQLGCGGSSGAPTGTAQASSGATATAPTWLCASSSPSSPSCSPRAPREARLCLASEAACAWAARVARGAAASSLCAGPPLLSADAAAKRRDLRTCVVRASTLLRW